MRSAVMAARMCCMCVAASHLVALAVCAWGRRCRGGEGAQPESCASRLAMDLEKLRCFCVCVVDGTNSYKGCQVDVSDSAGWELSCCPRLG